MKTLFAFAALIFFSGVAFSQEPCDPKTGTAKKNSLAYSLNPYKNRRTVPTKAQLKTSITLTKILGPGEDTDRFKNTDGAVVEGFVISTRLADKESANCESVEPKSRDFHIYIAKTADEKDPAKMMMVNITPKVRATKGAAWSPTKIEQLKGHKVKFTGWMFFDAEHRQAASHTNTTGITTIERATAWEIHPVTDFVMN